MAAALTVPQLSPSLNPSQPDERLTPRQGVVTLYGYGISVRVDRGHLVIDDGIGVPRRRARFSRVLHGLRRLVVVGSDGMVSLAALRWLADQDVAFVMLDRDGSVLVATGPVRPSESRLRRAQAVAHLTGTAMPIIRHLIDQKLAGQARIAHEMLRNVSVAEAIMSSRDRLRVAETPAAVRQLEAQAALAYWSAWHDLPVMFPRSDLRRVPDHWRTFGARRSPISNSPRLAVNPTNAILNYLYALLESEARLAAAALGFDPGIGILHVDTDARDSLACDLMEPVRPHVDAYVLDWLTREPLHRGWFFEQPSNGNCRLMGPFAMRLSETAPAWRRAVAPVAEWLSEALWSTVRKPARDPLPPTPLTQRHRREARDGVFVPVIAAPRPPRVCRGCGAPLSRVDHNHCAACGGAVGTEALVKGAERGRVASHTPEAEARRAAALRRNLAAQREWNQTEQPAWLSDQTYAERIQPRLAGVRISTLASALGVSRPYAVNIRAGRRRPHPRHWLALARLVGIPSNQ
jgi:CRISPR-associated endonuclease Cas1